MSKELINLLSCSIRVGDLAVLPDGQENYLLSLNEIVSLQGRYVNKTEDVSTKWKQSWVAVLKDCGNIYLFDEKEEIPLNSIERLYIYDYMEFKGIFEKMVTQYKSDNHTKIFSYFTVADSTLFNKKKFRKVIKDVIKSYKDRSLSQAWFTSNLKIWAWLFIDFIQFSFEILNDNIIRSRWGNKHD